MYNTHNKWEDHLPCAITAYLKYCGIEFQGHMYWKTFREKEPEWCWNVKIMSYEEYVTMKQSSPRLGTGCTLVLLPILSTQLGKSKCVSEQINVSKCVKKNTQALWEGKSSNIWRGIYRIHVILFDIKSRTRTRYGSNRKANFNSTKALIALNCAI